MRLTLAFLDDPQELVPHGHHGPQWVPVEGKQFENQRIVVDNHQFAHCSFRRCAFLYAGGPFGFLDCEIDVKSGVLLTGAAARGFVLWKKFDEMPGRHLPGSG